MPVKDIQRIEKFKKLKRSPDIALFRLIEEIEARVREEIADFKGKMEDSLLKEIEGLKLHLSAEAEKVRDNVLKGVTQIKGEKGEKGNTGERGNEGEVKIQGVIGPQGPIGERGSRGERGERGEEGLLGQIGKPGEIGERGSSDTPEEVKDKLERLKGEARLDSSAIKGLQVVMGRMRTLHRGGVDMKYSVSLGSGNGSTTAFTLPSDLFNTDKMAVFVGTARMFVTDDYTKTSTVITFLTAPPDGAEVRIDYQSNVSS